MEEVEIRFDEGRDGIVPVGTYLSDAASRMGAASIDCSETDEHECKFRVTQGSDLLSEPTTAEKEVLSNDELKRGYRLACYATIDKPGVINAMVEKKKETETQDKETENREEAYRKEFTELPLEKKIANLVQLEAIALGETFAFVINSPFKVFEKIGDVMAEFGFKKEEEQKRRARPSGSANGKKNSHAGARKDPAGDEEN